MWGRRSPLPHAPQPCLIPALPTPTPCAPQPWMESALEGLSQSFAGQAAGLTTFSEELAHWIMAAADYVLVPSRFEPCGLVAQCAARYGAVPIVTAVGGLKDLVTPEVQRLGVLEDKEGEPACLYVLSVRVAAGGWAL